VFNLPPTCLSLFDHRKRSGEIKITKHLVMLFLILMLL